MTLPNTNTIFIFRDLKQLEGKQTADVHSCPLSVTYNVLEINFGDSICAAKSAMLAHLKALNLDI